MRGRQGCDRLSSQTRPWVAQGEGVQSHPEGHTYIRDQTSELGNPEVSPFLAYGPTLTKMGHKEESLRRRDTSTQVEINLLHLTQMRF